MVVDDDIVFAIVQLHVVGRQVFRDVSTAHRVVLRHAQRPTAKAGGL